MNAPRAFLRQRVDRPATRFDGEEARLQFVHAATPGWAVAQTSALGQHLFWRVLKQSLYVLAALAAVLLTIQLLNIADLLIQARSALSLVFEIGLALIPAMVVVMLPIALLIGSVRVFHALDEDSELVAMETIGVSRRVWGISILSVASLLAVACFALSLFVEPLGNKAQSEIVGSLRQDAIRLLARPGGFNEINGNFFVKVAERLPDGGLKDVLLIDGRDPRVQKIYSAKLAYFSSEWGDNSILFTDGAILVKNVADHFPSRIAFRKYTLSLGGAPGSTESPDGAARRQTTYELLTGCDTECGTGATTVELCRRFSDWLYVLAFGAIGFYMAGRPKPGRGGRRWTLAAGVPIAITIRGLGFLFVSQSGASPIASASAYALPLLATAVFLLAGIRRDGFRDYLGRLNIRLKSPERRVSASAPS